MWSGAAVNKLRWRAPFIHFVEQVAVFAGHEGQGTVCRAVNWNRWSRSRRRVCVCGGCRHMLSTLGWHITAWSENFITRSFSRVQELTSLGFFIVSPKLAGWIDFTQSNTLLQ